MSASDALDKHEEGKEDASEGGELLYCGGTNWDTIGRKATVAAENLVSPNRVRPLLGVDIRFVASGCFVLVTPGKLAEGSTRTFRYQPSSLPTVVFGLAKHKIVGAAAGRNHTVVIADDGKSYAFGFNKHGQLGTGSTKNEIEAFPVASLVAQATKVACGADFTVWLSSADGSSILTAGLPQYGQLGHGTDNEYNTKDSSVKLAYEPQSRPRAIAAFSEKLITKVACGTNHTVAVDSSGFVYTWGFGGYGRLGHREQKDEWVPRLVEVFQRQNVLPPDAVVAAGSVSSACTAGGGQLYMWGKLKTTGDEWMYPKPVMDLSGWNIRCMSSGNMHHIVGADDSCISWGYAQYGELGYGSLGPKSSANPKKIDVLDGMQVKSVACGLGLSLIVVDRKNIGGRLDKLEVYDGGIAEGTADTKDAAVKDTAKKRTTNSSSSKKRKQEESSAESEDAVDESGDSDDANGDSAGKNVKRRGRRNAAKTTKRRPLRIRILEEEGAGLVVELMLKPHVESLEFTFSQAALTPPYTQRVND
ncbi:hypothetical protein HPP92_024217 [Vanilla planifolia]|uniref:RCC1-like domain-containing protein n=1 Tax=Vanilla planifolia TaxID=51239 RepID=A0A835UB47_VANPL|nr:hypothetical protein HPP92_024217 [Vanilla planifolia]